MVKTLCAIKLLLRTPNESYPNQKPFLSTFQNVSNPKALLTAAASVADTARIANDFIPNGVRDFLVSTINKVFCKFSSKFTKTHRECAEFILAIHFGQSKDLDTIAFDQAAESRIRERTKE
jgi:hypothetical protein